MFEKKPKTVTLDDFISSVEEVKEQTSSKNEKKSIQAKSNTVKKKPTIKSFDKDDKIIWLI